MKILDTLSLSFRTVRSNKLRTGITVAIIAFGIMALVGISTAIDAMKQKFTESFASMGANGFTIHYKDFNFFRRDDGVKKEKKGERKEKKSAVRRQITRDEAESFKQRFQYPAKTSINIRGVQDAIVSLGNKKTNPTVCIIGSDIVKKFFGNNPERALEKIIKINSIPYRVIGALDSKGSSLGFSWDNFILISYNNLRRFFSASTNTSFNIQVKVPDVKLVDAAIGESEGVFRPIRRLGTTEANNFVIDKSDRFVEELLRNLGFITISAVVIGGITLLGAAVGLMNIMLVSVTERTKEIGLVKAIGGRKSSIRRQFLYESIIISLLGAGFGIVLGIMVGNSFSLVLSTGFVVPWMWLIGGIVLCTIVGLLAGLYPSIKASRLNPIEALRYE